MMPLITILLPGFLACYTLALAVELRRQFAPGRLSARWTLALLGVGWLLHTAFLVAEWVQGIPEGLPLGSWHHWWFMLAWLIALASGLWIRLRPQTAVGLFALVPLVALVLVAWQLPRDVPFPVHAAHRAWLMLHGVFLLLGTGTVLLGSVAGMMYLLQSDRLRRKRSAKRGLRLPSLEWLQRVNELSFLVSSLLVMAGLVVGALSNLHLREDSSAGVPWTDPVVWTSGVLLAWLLAADLFSLLYKPARQGRKVAYLTLASVAFLLIVLGMLLLSPTQHTRSDNAAQVPEMGRISDAGGLS